MVGPKCPPAQIPPAFHQMLMVGKYLTPKDVLVTLPPLLLMEMAASVLNLSLISPNHFLSLAMMEQ